MSDTSIHTLRAVDVRPGDVLMSGHVVTHVLPAGKRLSDGTSMAVDIHYAVPFHLAEGHHQGEWEPRVECYGTHTHGQVFRASETVRVVR